MADEETTEDEKEDQTPNESAEGDGTQSDGDNADTDAESPANAETAEEPDSPEFPELKKGGASGKVGDLNRFYDVQVTVAAELGRTSVPIQQLVGLTEGSVFELNRDISAPIELIAQGVPLGNGEVVVVDDSFAIRIKEIYSDQT